ncbi:MAG: hypothetical protein OIF50_10260, partial [Flavobacteriaceae bacterium]|nr:hypothetical protein [Flavobacteriaceae bacterium]
FQLGFVHSKHNQTEDLENHTDLETTNPLFEDSHTVEDITKTNKTDSDSVCSETSSPNLQKQELQLHYRWEGKGINAQNNPAAVLHAGAVFLEQKEPSGAIEKIAAAIGKASYPAQLQFNYANISHLVNHSSLVAQWEITKERLLIENSGDYAKAIVEKADRYIQNKYVLLEKLKQSWFLVCYQLLLRIQFAGRDYFETTMGFPIATGCSPIAYRVQAEKHPFCNSNGKLVVYLHGSPCDSRSLAAIEAGKKFDQQNAGKAITGSLAATAIFDASHQYIEQLFGHIRIHLQNSCKTVEIGLYKKDSL